MTEHKITLAAGATKVLHTAGMYCDRDIVVTADGGGKREGTAIPVGQYVEYVFLNLSNTQEETNAILSKLTFVQTPLLDYPVYVVCGQSYGDGDVCVLIVIDLGDGKYSISRVFSIINGVSAEFFDGIHNGSGSYYNGWKVFVDGKNLAKSSVPCAIDMSIDGVAEILGIPVGTQNELIKDVLSITPYFAEKTTPATVEGTAIPVGKPVDRIYFNIENTVEETNALLSQLTYVEGLLEVPICFIYVCVDANGEGNYFVATDNTDGTYSIEHWGDMEGNYCSWLFGSPDAPVNGWAGRSVEWGKHCVNRQASIFADLSTTGMVALTDFEGMVPIGAENEKIKNVLSITPF